MQLTVTVTKEHIRAGEPGGCCTCPVALALEHATGTTWSVANMEIWPQGAPLACSISLPVRARAFIQAFDQGYHVRPFSFELDIPDAFVARPTLIQSRGRWAWAEELLEGRGPVYRAFAGVVVGLSAWTFFRIVLGLLQARAEGRL